jgi:hypothetical protein
LWIGGSDLKEGQWLWNEDFSPMKYTNWNKGEPNGGSSESCVNYMDQPEYPERITDHGQATGKLYHLRLRVECTLFVIYQSGREPTPYS